AGKDNVFLLEGGMKHWLENRLETTTDIPEPKQSTSLSLTLDKTMIAEIADVKIAATLKDTAIVDSRAYERYAGQVEPLDKLPGHIPNALNYPWMDLVDEGNIIDNEEISEKFKPLKNYEE